MSSDAVPKEGAMRTQKVGSLTFFTTNTKQAAAFATVGLPLRKHDPVTNIHDKDHPVRGGAPGKVTYHFEGETKQSVEVLVQAWEGRTADAELDGKLAELAEKEPRLAEALEEIRELIPLAAICSIRAALENRERLLELVGKATPLVMIQRGEGAVLVGKNPTPAVRQRFRI